MSSEKQIAARQKWGGWNKQPFGKPAGEWKPCTFSWWAHFETPPDLFYAVAQQRAREQDPERTT